MLPGALARGFCTILEPFAPVWALAKKFSVWRHQPSSKCFPAPLPEAFAPFWALAKKFSSGFKKQR